MEFVKRNAWAVGIGLVVLFVVFYFAFSSGSDEGQTMQSGVPQTDPNVAAAGAAVQQASIAAAVRNQEIEAGLQIAEMTYAYQEGQSSRELQYSLEELAAKKTVAVAQIDSQNQYYTLQEAAASKAINAQVQQTKIQAAQAVNMTKVQASITKSLAKIQSDAVRVAGRQNMQIAKANARASGSRSNPTGFNIGYGGTSVGAYW